MRFANQTATFGVAALLAAQPAMADVTPQQVWDDLDAYLQSFGYEVSATESMAGDTLTVSDLSLRLAIPDANGGLSMAMEQMTFTDTGDGSVRVDLPQSIPISVDVAPEDEESMQMVIDHGLEGFSMLVSGSPGDMTYDYEATRMTLALGSLTVDGEDIPRSAARATLSAGPVDGETQVTVTGEQRHIVQTASLGELAYDIFGRDPEVDGDSENSGMFKGSMSGFAIESDSTVPMGLDTSDMPALLEAGFSVSGRMSYDASESQFSGTEDGKATTGESSSEGGSFEFALSPDGVRYATSAQALNISMTTPEFPFPLSAEMDEMGLSFSAPLSKSDEPQDFSLGLTLAGFTTSDMIWNIFDPGQVLPRDPATIALDLTGKATPYIDFLDPEQVETLEGGDTKPGELNALTLENLQVKAVGAEITGSGAFTFDNSDLETFDGMPAPSGAIDLTVAGANGLIDRLVEMGFIPEEQAMGTRMMMSMFGVPGSEPDTMTSKIEVRENGQVFANGQRIK
ncbi:MAG: DUF2125 domain-containing protein [Rhodobacteraceae bacterium]|jgi:hypothetical protein|uniref:Putative DUF2125 protein n=1 Tax=Salipiger profundus TaxID=1229727 RepID=A0A1U7D5I0_9RHOB|nr:MULTISPECIES: DUF2125 domain-containing protein [Salipiger]APX23372.1 putative DUF2125 protein [Salipiger profundus]MAB09135.1 DUF2125 domain-containing protein [Paracoccaceae bacterium]GGA24234.1 hypothetical protein GCM10011326_40740 [Salipiger profundus]SFD45280.1 hypothetical protein SAMN05444415_11126 [Salipiger profundus]